jgi:hypothetical protein
MATTHIVVLRQTKFGTKKDYGHIYKFYLNHCFFNGNFEYGDGEIFKLLWWMQHLHKPTWVDEILCAVTSSKDEKLLIRPLLQESKNTNMPGG